MLVARRDRNNWSTIARMQFRPLVAVLVGCLLVGQVVDSKSEKELKGVYARPGISAAELLRDHGYLAKEFFFYTKDGYKINMVRGRNPLFKKGKSALAGTLPILFIHGTVDAAPTLLSSLGTSRPRNFRKLVPRPTKIKSVKKLIKLLGNDPSTGCLPVLALNFGYEIWMINRRGFNRSKGRRGHENRTLLDAIVSMPVTFLANGFHPMAGLDPSRNDKTKANGTEKGDNAAERRQDKGWTFLRNLLVQSVTLKSTPGAIANFGKFQEHFIQTFDPDYWDFSLDEQAKYDITEGIEFVVKKTGCSRVHTSGISSGGALLLMAAAEKPKLASKIASAALWAPSLNMGSAKDIVYQLSQLIPIVQSYRGPIPFVFNQQQIDGLIQDLCSTDDNQRNLCPRIFDLLFGFSGTQAPLLPINIANIPEPTSAFELQQLGQFAHTGKPCKFQYSDPKRNLEQYGQLEPPCYDLGRIKARHITFYGGNTDILVSPSDLNQTISQMRVPVKLVLIKEPGIYFNHVGSITHEQRNRLVIVPSLLDFERAQESHSFSSEAAKCHSNDMPKNSTWAQYEA